MADVRSLAICVLYDFHMTLAGHAEIIAESDVRLIPAPFPYGIHSLPVELLSSIFKLAALRSKTEKDEGYNFSDKFKFNERMVKALCLTNRRFFQVTASCAEIWTHIHCSMPPDLMSLFLERSKGIDLHVGISFNTENEEAVRKSLHHVDKWRILAITEGTTLEKNFLNILKYAPSVQCKAVRELSTALPELSWDKDSAKCELVKTFYEQWSFPNLKRLCINDTIGVASMNSLPYISELIYAPWDSADLTNLVTILGLTRSLKILKIDLNAVHSLHALDSDIDIVTELPSLTFLRVDGVGEEFQDEGGWHIQDMLRALHMPKLEHVHFTLQLGDSNHELKLFDGLPYLLSVKHLTLELLNNDWPDVDLTTPFVNVLEHFPALSSFDLTTLGVHLSDSFQDISESGWANLRRITIKQASPCKLYAFNGVGRDLSMKTDGWGLVPFDDDSIGMQLRPMLPESVVLSFED